MGGREPPHGCAAEGPAELPCVRVCVCVGGLSVASVHLPDAWAGLHVVSGLAGVLEHSQFPAGCRRRFLLLLLLFLIIFM